MKEHININVLIQKIAKSTNKKEGSMEITFLGTSAATSFPLAFCQCETCSLARKLGGKNFRKRSSILINKDLLIDLGPDLVTSTSIYKKSIVDIKYCLQTHPHSHHFDASHFTTRIPEYAVVNIPHLNLFASEATLKKMSNMLKNEGYINNILDSKEKKRLNISVYPIKHFQSFVIDKYQITAFPSNHDKKVDSLLYAVTENNCTIFYGTDTNIISEETWSEFHKEKLQFDIVILDHTYGPNIDGDGHLNAKEFINHIQRMKKEDLLKTNSRIFATHISHEGNSIHSEMVMYGQEHGYEVAYDGLTIKG